MSLQALTLKQRGFVKEYINNGGNGAQAAAQVYDTDPLVGRSIASENLTKPDIRQAVEEALTKNGLTPQVITEKMKNLVAQEPEKVSADTILRTSVELLKLWGAYPGTKHTNLNLSLRGDVNKMSYSEARETLKKIREDNDSVLQDTEDTTITPTDTE